MSPLKDFLLLLAAAEQPYQTAIRTTMAHHTTLHDAVVACKASASANTVVMTVLVARHQDRELSASIWGDAVVRASVKNGVAVAVLLSDEPTGDGSALLHSRAL